MDKWARWINGEVKKNRKDNTIGADTHYSNQSESIIRQRHNMFRDSSEFQG